MSTLRADIINNTAGDTLFVDGYPRQPGRIIETLMLPCDGQTVTVASGTYTSDFVTVPVIGTTTYVAVTGSAISYCPPPETTTVVYRFNFSAYWADTLGIGHFRFYIDGNEVVYARHNRCSTYLEYRDTFEWPIVCNAAATDYNYGRLSSWTQPRDLYLWFRDYGTSNNLNLHGTVYWDGAASNQFNQPQLSIIAIA